MFSRRLIDNSSLPKMILERDLEREDLSPLSPRDFDLQPRSNFASIKSAIPSWRTVSIFVTANDKTAVKFIVRLDWIPRVPHLLSTSFQRRYQH